MDIAYDHTGQNRVGLCTFEKGSKRRLRGRRRRHLNGTNYKVHPRE